MRTGNEFSAAEAIPWLESFAKGLSRDHLAAITIRGYCHDIQNFIRWYETRHQTHLREELQRKPSSVNRRMDALRRWFRWGLQAGKFKPQLPLPSHLARRSQPGPLRSLSHAQVQALLRAAGCSPHGLAARNYALVQLLLHSGLRLTEATLLQVGEVTLRERVGWIQIRGSRRAAARQLALNIKVRRALSDYLKPRGRMNPKTPLFCSKRRGPLSVRAMQVVLAALGQRAKLNWGDFPARVLRHTFALAYLRAHPGQFLELSKRLGYVSVASTAIYRQSLCHPGSSSCPSSPAKFSGR